MPWKTEELLKMSLISFEEETTGKIKWENYKESAQ